MTSLHEYAKNRLFETYREHIYNTNSWENEFGLIERMITDAWDGSEYHAPAHMYMVAATALELGARMGLESSDLHALVIAGLFHDAGRRAIDDKLNLEAANWLADKYIDAEIIFADEFQKRAFKGLVRTSINGTLYPPTEPVTHYAAKILRDADFASLIAPDEIYEQACVALEKEGGNRASYDFIISQGALLPVTVGYYKDHGLNIRLIEDKENL